MEKKKHIVLKMNKCDDEQNYPLKDAIKNKDKEIIELLIHYA